MYSHPSYNKYKVYLRPPLKITHLRAWFFQRLDMFVSIKFDLGNVESDEYELSLTKHNWTQPRRYDI